MCDRKQGYGSKLDFIIFNKSFLLIDVQYILNIHTFLWSLDYWHIVLATVMSNLWPFCVSTLDEGCLSACTLFLICFITQSSYCSGDETSVKTSRFANVLSQIRPIWVIFTHLKGLAQAEIIKKSVIIFWLLNMTIWCKHVHRLELQIFYNFRAAHSPVRLDIERNFLISNYWQPCQKLEIREFRLYI